MAPKFLIRHLGNLGDLVFLVPPVLATLKRRYPDCHITLVTVWGFKEKWWRWENGKISAKHHWGKRHQDGASIALMMTNPHIDQLVHWHDTKLSLTGDICQEEGQAFPTWNPEYYHAQVDSGQYIGVYELDCGLPPDTNPLTYLYKVIGLSDESYSDYTLYLTDHDRAVAADIMRDVPKPRIILLESLLGTSTRGWDPGKVPALEAAIEATYGVPPMWFGAAYQPYYQGRSVSLRENIALLEHGDVAIGVMSGPLHFAAAVGLPTITLYGEQPVERAAPAPFLNPYITDPAKHHRTILGPSSDHYDFLKPEHISAVLTPAEQANQKFVNWQQPGRQATKSCLGVITVDEIMRVLADSLK